MFVCTPAEFMAAEPAERRKLVLAQIDATPELHDQSHWSAATSCGTAYCMAGWACALSGVDWEPGTYAYHDGGLGVARELMGLPVQAKIMFNGCLTRDDLVEMVGIVDEAEALGVDDETLYNSLNSVYQRRMVTLTKK